MLCTLTVSSLDVIWQLALLANNLMVYFSMLDMMDCYTNELEERLEHLSKKNQGGVNFVPDDVALNMELQQCPSFVELANFCNYRMAVMMMCVDAATESDCSFVEIVREEATSVVGEVIVVEEEWNSITVAVAPHTSQSTGTPVSQLLVLAEKVSNKVSITLLSVTDRSCIMSIHVHSVGS